MYFYRGGVLHFVFVLKNRAEQEGLFPVFLVEKIKNINKKKGGSPMKQKYLSPEVEVTLLLADDIIALSEGDDELKNEIDIDSEGLW